MKILFDHPLPFALAHGGFQVQIEQTMAALQRSGVEVELLRWWDENQRGDLIHFFGRPSGAYIDFAHAKGCKVVVAELLSGLGSRSRGARLAQKAAMRAAEALLPASFLSKLAWDAYRKADAVIALTTWEAQLMAEMFQADRAKIEIVPNGVEAVFDRPHEGGRYLVCTAAIDPRKRVVELATACAQAQVPVWIVGKPYAETDPYHQLFLAIRQAHPDWVRYEGAITDRETLAGIYARARGFVLLSTRETLSLSAYEAAAAGCPLLLSDLPWARSVFGAEARYVSVAADAATLAEALRRFYDQAESLPAPSRPPSWDEIGARFAAIYRKVLAAG
jgi:glycosyltransferase involved in cell wall biosynthesis